MIVIERRLVNSSVSILPSVHLRFPQLNVDSVEKHVEKPVEKECIKKYTYCDV